MTTHSGEEPASCGAGIRSTAVDLQARLACYVGSNLFPSGPPDASRSNPHPGARPVRMRCFFGSGAIRTPRRVRSGAEEREWDDSDAVGPAIGESPGVDDDPVDQPITDLLVEPVEMFHVVVIDGVGQVGLNGDARSVGGLDDEVDLVLVVLGA